MHSKQEKYKAALACFQYNKNQDTCFVTGDLECFSNRNLAVNHGRKLEDTTVEVFERDGDAVISNTGEATSSTAEANTKPDSKLANDHANGENLNQQFAKVKPGGNPVTAPAAPEAPKAPAAPEATKPAAAPKAPKAPAAPKAIKPAAATKAPKAPAAPKATKPAAAPEAPKAPAVAEEPKAPAADETQGGNQ